MADSSDAALDRLWKEYSVVFHDFDDFTLARWLAQTLGQIEGRVWRLSHPLVGAYRLAAQLAQEREIWSKRMATPPQAYPPAPCCGAPLLALFTRDILETGLICQSCGETAVPFDDLDFSLRREFRDWAEEYAPLHAIAHWEDDKRRGAHDYEDQLDDAAEQVEQLLARAGSELAPKLLEALPAIIWEDQDECLEVRPEDIVLK